MVSGQIWKKNLLSDQLLQEIHVPTLYPALPMGHYTARYRQAVISRNISLST